MGRLLRILGVGFGLAVIIGNTIGAGILRTPGDVAGYLPTPFLFLAIWVVGGLYALLGANSLAELGTMLPQSGGQYVFAKRALGPYAGFVVGWSDWISTCGSAAAVAIVIGDYSTDLFDLDDLALVIALAVVVAFAVVQWRGMKWGSRTQEITSLLKALAFLVLIAASFVVARGSHPPVAEGPIPPLAAFVFALQAVIYTYDGWSGVIYFSEEVRDPRRDIPRAMFGGVLSILAIYLMFNAALLYVVPIGELAGSKLAAGVAARKLFGPGGDRAIMALTILSMLSAMNAYQLMASRVLFGMSRDRIATDRARSVNEGGTPTVALAISTVVALLFLVTGTFNRVISVLSFFFVASYTISFVSLIVLRRREPEAERPFRCWGYPWTNAMALAGSIAFLAGAAISDPRNTAWSIALLALSYPVYRVMRAVRERAGAEA